MTPDLKDDFKVLRDTLMLTSEERSSMRVALLETDTGTSALMVRPLPSPLYSQFSFARQGALAFATLLLLVSGGGIAAAEGALPGDALYGVKLGLNERVERIAAFGTVAKAEVDIRHAEERIHEVELLSAKGEGDARAVADIALAVDEHIERASLAAKALAKDGDTADADRVAARIDSALSAHAEILEAQAENEGEAERRKLRALSVALSVSAKERVPEEDPTLARTGDYYERILASREQEASRRTIALKEAIQNDGVSEESLVELRGEQVAIEAEIEATRVVAAEGDYRDAAEAYDELRKRAYRAYALITSAKRIADETDKEVVVSLNGEAAVDAVIELPSEAEAALFMTTGPVQDETTIRNTRRDDDGPTLRFWIRDRQ